MSFYNFSYEHNDIDISLLVSMGCHSQPFKCTVSNPSACKRTNELIVISRADMEKHMVVGESFSFVDENNNAIVTQLDDLDKSGKEMKPAFYIHSRQIKL